MNKFLLKFGLVTLLCAAVAGTPLALRAQATNITIGPRKAAARVFPFRGKLKAIDNTAKTISIGNETIQITSETKITKANKPATLQDGAVGDMVAGAYHKEADGKLNAVSLRFAPAVLTSRTNKTDKATNTP